MYLFHMFGIAKKQVLKNNYLKRTKVPGYISNVGCECFSANARLFNDEVKGVSSSSEVASTVNSLNVIKTTKDGIRKINIHNLLESNKTREINNKLKSKNFGLCEVI